MFTLRKIKNLTIRRLPTLNFSSFLRSSHCRLGASDFFIPFDRLILQPATRK